VSVKGKAESRIVRFPELASAGLWTTPSDLARLMINLQQSGRDGAVLSRKAYAELLTPVINNSGLGVFLAGHDDSLRMRIRGTDGLADDGFTAWFVGYAQGGKGAIVMTNNNALATGFSLLRSIAQQYGWNNYIPTRQVVQVDDETLKRVSGKFDLTGDVVTFTADSTGFYGQISGGRRLPLLASSPLTYFVNIDMFDELELKFVQRPDGMVKEAVFQYPYFSYRSSRIE
jgi:hypothetical protein